MNKIITLKTGNQATIYPSENISQKYVIYLHGGGLVYGSGADIPGDLVAVYNEMT